MTTVIEGALAHVSGLKSPHPGVFNVSDAIGCVTNCLPDDADQQTIIKAHSDSQPSVRLAVTSSTLGIYVLTLLVENQIVDRLFAAASLRKSMKLVSSLSTCIATRWDCLSF